MATYTIDSKTSRLVVTAHSSVHDSETTWGGIVGTVNATPGMMADTQASITVDMRTADAGDWLKNRKLKKDLEVERYPSARFTLSELRDVAGEGSLTATANGTIDWRGHKAKISATGSATITDQHLLANATFELNVTQLGVTPPRILMIKVADVVRVEVVLRAICR